MPQTSYTQAPVQGKAGLVTEEHIAAVSSIPAIVDRTAGIAPGLLVLRTASGDRAGSTQPVVAAVADNDAIMTDKATAASEQVFDTEADGVVALTRISPPRKITVTRDNHADHDAVTAVLAGLDENGLPISENLTFANGGNEVVTSVNRYSYFTSLTIPAQAGTGGLTRIGIDASLSLDGYDVLGVSMLSHKALLDPSSSDNEVYEDEDVMPVLRKGRIYVDVETSWRAGDCPLVRMIAAGAEVYGAFRAEGTDSGDAFPWRGARFLDSGSSAGVGLLEVNIR